MANTLGGEDLGRRVRQAKESAGWLGLSTAGGRRVFPSIIVSARDDVLLVRAEVPGMKLEDFDIRMVGDSLVINGTRVTGGGLQGGWYHRRERESGGFSRAVSLPAEVDGDRADAAYVAGILTISLPLKKTAKPTQVPVKVAEG